MDNDNLELKYRCLLGALADLLPKHLTVEALHEFTDAPLGLCVRVLREVDDFRAKEAAHDAELLEDARIYDHVALRHYTRSCG